MNFEELLNDDCENMLDAVQTDIKNGGGCDLDTILDFAGYNIDDLEGLDHDLSEAIYDYCLEYFWEGCEVYQYFIVPEYDVERYWSEYTSYPIFYNDVLDVYLIGITHYGMAWKYFNTNFKVIVEYY